MCTAWFPSLQLHHKASRRCSPCWVHQSGHRSIDHLAWMALQQFLLRLQRQHQAILILKTYGVTFKLCMMLNQEKKETLLCWRRWLLKLVALFRESETSTTPSKRESFSAPALQASTIQELHLKENTFYNTKYSKHLTDVIKLDYYLAPVVRAVILSDTKPACISQKPGKDRKQLGC